jgi:RNA polymerase sigma-70 factor (ECF subfamily)
MNTYATSCSVKSGPTTSLAEVSTIAVAQEHPRFLTDDVLVARTRAGDFGALGQLLGRHERTLLRVAYRVVRDEEDAQEVLQDVFVTTWRKLSGFEDRAQIGSWLYRITVNAALMRLRARNRRPRVASLDDGDGAAFDANEQPAVEHHARFRPDEQLESQELKRVIRQAIEALPPTLHQVFDLRETQGWSTRQTARLLGISEAAVKTRFHRARLVLRARIERYLVQ